MEYLKEFWHRILQCCHCAEEQSTLGYEPSERTHLLADPTNSPALHRTNSENFNQSYSQSAPQKDDQNALLCRLVQNTAVNMIDVGAMDSLFNNLEHQEINDRIKTYSHRLQQQWSNVQHPNRASTGLLKDLPDPENLLLKMNSLEDLNQIKDALIKVHSAINEIKVEHVEDIVVPFQIV